MRFRILNTWLLVTAVIASLSLVSCKKDCGESSKGSTASDPPSPTYELDSFSFYVHFIDAKTGKSLIGDGPNAKLQAEEVIFQEDKTRTDLSNFWVPNTKAQNNIFGPCYWRFGKGGIRAQYVYEVRKKDPSNPGSTTLVFQQMIDTWSVARIIDECNSEIIAIDYFYDKVRPNSPKSRYFLSRGTGQGDTLRIEVEL
ncbi:MAG: hypothetical protein EAZ57_05495 [Cytophagales bacterium]|nr:MAG: hypothetical protein EAZ67_12930 [Cytophagales bacterium]TAF60998.1 MAG: hypothetical protein EAZ57_05495 [Cytophagales bacterium]